MKKHEEVRHYTSKGEVKTFTLRLGDIKYKFRYSLEQGKLWWMSPMDDKYQLVESRGITGKNWAEFYARQFIQNTRGY